jgi:hypothetical protein
MARIEAPRPNEHFIEPNQHGVGILLPQLLLPKLGMTLPEFKSFIDIVPPAELSRIGVEALETRGKLNPEARGVVAVAVNTPENKNHFFISESGTVNLSDPIVMQHPDAPHRPYPMNHSERSSDFTAHSLRSQALTDLQKQMEDALAGKPGSAVRCRSGRIAVVGIGVKTNLADLDRFRATKPPFENPSDRMMGLYRGQVLEAVREAFLGRAA